MQRYDYDHGRLTVDTLSVSVYKIQKVYHALLSYQRAVAVLRGGQGASPPTPPQ